ncbi:MAG TPA: WD40 repeat domain-containing protein [Bradyrhizobium sp.]|nr:WD40 repeat domain-containing protein [Bradyrhizobium sp.]
MTAQLYVWRLNDETEMHMSGYMSKPCSLSWSADGEWLASSGAESVVLWPFRGKDPMQRTASTFERRPALVVNVPCHPKKAMVAAGYDDGALLFAPQRDGDALMVRDTDGDVISDMAFDAEGHVFAYGTEQGGAGDSGS